MTVDDRIGLLGAPPRGVFERHVPELARLVVFAAEHARVESHVAAHVVLLDHAQQVGLELRPGRGVVAPVRIQFEGIGVEMAGRVHGHAGVDVLVPGAADLRVLLDHVEPVAGFPELDCGRSW
jgi:hypothetical protein